MMNIGLSKKIIAFTLITIFLLGISGCKSKKISLVDGSGTLKSKSQEEVVEDVLTHELNYKTITTKGKVSLNGKEIPAPATFKLVKDDIIQVSVRAPFIGFEIMRMDITPEKAVLIDRPGSRYAEIDLSGSELSDYVAFNFYNLQALLTNQLFLAGNKRVTKSDYKEYNISASKDHYVLQASDKNDLKYHFSVDASDRIVSTMINSEAKEIGLVWTYDQFVVDKEFIYPTSMAADVKFKKRKFKIGIAYSSLDVNSDFNIDRSISSKYKKVGMLELIEAYMKIK